MQFNQIAKTVLITGSLVLAGCSTGGAKKADYLAACMSETGAKGSYSMVPGRVSAQGYPVVAPAAGGDARGAVLLEACIERRAKADGVAPTKQAAPRAQKGKLPLPVGYALLPGDAELWSTLTLAQQQRAMEFLKSGSTIQSSLQGDQ